jgi:hypothetical protein
MLSDEIRKAIRRSGKSIYRIGQHARVAEWSLYKFMKGEVGLSMGALDRLAAYLGVKVMGEGAAGAEEGTSDEPRR